MAGEGSVIRDGQNLTSSFPAFKVFLNSGTSKAYSIRNGGRLFDDNGTWSFAGTNFDKLVLTGVQPAVTRAISFTQIGTMLRFNFRIPVRGGARMDGATSLAGNYTFNLVGK